ncbi:MAG: hypothetical protein KGJ62_15420 [Armatimonadetes bacterium]|nr:hypothetical protein [Armatimonadota bacterium]MDE2207487.1 hypothetical protein [Armatimonadota bacterium]
MQKAPPDRHADERRYAAARRRMGQSAATIRRLPGTQPAGLDPAAASAFTGDSQAGITDITALLEQLSAVLSPFTAALIGLAPGSAAANLPLQADATTDVALSSSVSPLPWTLHRPAGTGITGAEAAFWQAQRVETQQHEAQLAAQFATGRLTPEAWSAELRAMAPEFDYASLGLMRRRRDAGFMARWSEGYRPSQRMDRSADAQMEAGVTGGRDASAGPAHALKALGAAMRIINDADIDRLKQQSRTFAEAMKTISRGMRELDLSQTAVAQRQMAAAVAGMEQRYSAERATLRSGSRLRTTGLPLQELAAAANDARNLEQTWLDEISAMSRLTSSLSAGQRDKRLAPLRAGLSAAEEHAWLLPREFAVQQFNANYRSVQGAMVDGSMQFLRGGEPFGRAVTSTADSVTNRILQAQLQKWLDPAVRATADQVTALTVNTRALGALTGILTGSSAGTAFAPAGAFGDQGTFGPSGPFSPNGAVTEWYQNSASEAPGGASPANAPSRAATGKDLTAALGAWSIASQGASQGVTLGSMAGGAATGLGLAGALGVSGPVGAAIGAGLTLIGGLFHHGPDPRYPSAYNAPSDFEYDFWRYQVTHHPSAGQPAPSHTAAANAAQHAMELHIHMPGMKEVVSRVILSQTSSAAANRVNVDLDTYTPI